LNRQAQRSNGAFPLLLAHALMKLEHAEPTVREKKITLRRWSWNSHA
jgi:hypothetical protein